MGVEANKALIRRGLDEGINARRAEVFDELLSPRYINYSWPAPATGPAGFKDVIAMFTAAFPDMRVELAEVVGQDDRVATRGTVRGTHQGEFMGIPATGRAVAIEYIDIWRLEDGQAIENWAQLDLLGLLRQLGVAQG
ncbi:MAG TPA: ester cyclase [Thermomicrobiaceae bacterium]|nr:ester cyclase [Thermomicrobiaceae bacterium]